MSPHETLIALEASLGDRPRKCRWDRIFSQLVESADESILRDAHVPSAYILWLRNGTPISVKMISNTEPAILDGYNKLLWCIAVGYHAVAVAAVGIADYGQAMKEDISEDYDVELAKVRAKPDGEALAMQLLCHDGYYASVRPIFRHPDGRIKAVGIDILSDGQLEVGLDPRLCDLLPPADLPNEYRRVAQGIAKTYFTELADD